MNNHTFPKIIRRPVILSSTGWSKSTLYNRLKEGLFPPAIDLGARAKGWYDLEVNKTIQAMIAGYSEQQLKALVQDLVAKRAFKL